MVGMRIVEPKKIVKGKKLTTKEKTFCILAFILAFISAISAFFFEDYWMYFAAGSLIAAAFALSFFGSAENEPLARPDVLWSEKDHE
jgi:hypothetical protein